MALNFEVVCGELEDRVLADRGLEAYEPAKHECVVRMIGEILPFVLAKYRLDEPATTRPAAQDSAVRDSAVRDSAVRDSAVRDSVSALGDSALAFQRAGRRISFQSPRFRLP